MKSFAVLAQPGFPADLPCDETMLPTIEIVQGLDGGKLAVSITRKEHHKYGVPLKIFPLKEASSQLDTKGDPAGG